MPSNSRLTGNAEQNNQAFARKQQQNSQPNGLSRGNIAAVEPYNHVPLQQQQQQQSQQIKNINSQQEVRIFSLALKILLYHPLCHTVLICLA